MPLRFDQVDAFADRPFTGNPAMVYRLDQWLPDAQMQRIAAEHNLSETAFAVREGEHWRIRWFTPATEVPLCGHATLATAHVLFEVYGEQGDALSFVCQEGLLSVSREAALLWLDFPAYPARQVAWPEGLEQALGQKVREVRGNKELLVVLESQQAVLDCQPDFDALAVLPYLGVIVTAQGDEHDFVSRYFAPGLGIDEDPVTGSTHCLLIPYWAERLDKLELRARQCSARGGELSCRLEGERVKIGGRAVRVASGELLV